MNQMTTVGPVNPEVLTPISKLQTRREKNDSVKGILDIISDGGGLAPSEIDTLIDTSDVSERSSRRSKIVTGSLAFGYGITYALAQSKGNSGLPTFGTLPDFPHQLLQSIHNVSTNSAESPAIRDHIPFIFGEAAVFKGILSPAVKAVRNRTRNGKLVSAQEVVKGATEAGEQKYKMSEGHTAVFSGYGDVYADALQASLPKDSVMQYASAGSDKTDFRGKVWQQLPRQEDTNKFFDSMTKGDFKNAGNVLILPIKKEDVFLPGPDGNDMDIDQIEALVSQLDKFCDDNKIPRKRIVIVANSDMSTIYTTVNSRTKESVERVETLNDRKNELVERRSAPIDIVDPTEVIMTVINKKAGDRDVQLDGDKQSMERYSERLISKLSTTELVSAEKPLRVIYNITDTPTSVKAEVDDIAVILDADKKNALMARGVPEENIIIVSEVIEHFIKAAVSQK